jgi:hypothetical protein
MEKIFAELKPRHIYGLAAFQAVVAWVLSACLALAAPQGGIPNFSLSANVGWQTDLAAMRRAARLTGVPYLLSPPDKPRPVTVDSTIYNEAHPFNFNDAHSAVVDLSNQNLLPWVVDVLRAVNERRASGKNFQQSPDARCWPPGLPGLSFTIDPTFFVQSPDEVMILQLRSNFQVRRIALNKKHSINPTPSWFGESVGHYENGDTLVVDTIGLNDKTFLDYFETPHTTALHVVERWKLIENGQGLELKVQIEDSGSFRAPYELTQRFRRVDQPWQEYVCTENPYDILHQGLEPVPEARAPDF